MFLIGFIKGIIIITVILIVAGFTYIVYVKIWDRKENIKQDKCSNFTETPKFYYSLWWQAPEDLEYPLWDNEKIYGDISEVRKKIKQLRKKYKDTLKYIVYEQRDLTDFIDWE